MAVSVCMLVVCMRGMLLYEVQWPCGSTNPGGPLHLERVRVDPLVDLPHKAYITITSLGIGKRRIESSASGCP